jgi:hypothetical protein
LNDIDSEVTSDSSSDEEDDEVDEKSTVAITTEVDPDLKLRKEKEKNKRLKEEMKSIRLEMRQVRAYNEMLEKNMKTVKSTKPTIAAIPEFRDVKHHISFSPKKSIYEKKELSTMEKKSTDSANLRPNDDVNNFDVKKEVAIVLGKGEAIDKGKTPKDMKFDLVIYTLDQSFAEWWKKFKYEVMTANLVGKGGQIKYSFNAHMDPVIKDYFRNMELPEAITLEDMLNVVIALYSRGNKNELDYEREFLNLSKEKNETVASYYLKVRILLFERISRTLRRSRTCIRMV